jgi:hypothetical protein
MRFTPFAFAGGQELQIYYLVVGGGSRENILTSGGSGGGIVSGSTSMFSGQTFDITVGKGGTAGDLNGYPSSISYLNIIGGGAGQTGSGAPQQFATGSSVPCGNFGERAAGGGAGSSQNGQIAGCSTPAQFPGAGGSGSLWTINQTYYGGGGGGGYTNTDDTPISAGGKGGPGGGGKGYGSDGVPVAGTNGLGGGGGGGGAAILFTPAIPAANGGSGSVIFAYTGPNQLAYGGNVSTYNEYIIHTFTENGIFYR